MERIGCSRKSRMMNMNGNFCTYLYRHSNALIYRQDIMKTVTAILYLTQWYSSWTPSVEPPTCTRTLIEFKLPQDISSLKHTANITTPPTHTQNQHNTVMANH
jgi:hypothetical protein